MASAVKNAVTEPVVTGPASSLSNYGTASAPQIVYVNGDLTLTGNKTGYGILVVTGTLTVKGTVQWNGLVLVVGQGNLQMDGTNTFTGAVVVAKTKDSSGNALSTLGSPTFGVNGGGNSNGGRVLQRFVPGTSHAADHLSLRFVPRVTELEEFFPPKRSRPDARAPFDSCARRDSIYSS